MPQDVTGRINFAPRTRGSFSNVLFPGGPFKGSSRKNLFGSMVGRARISQQFDRPSQALREDTLELTMRTEGESSAEQKPSGKPTQSGKLWPREEQSEQAPRGSVDLDALAEGDEMDIYSLKMCGYLMQYFTVGLIYGGLPATAYGYFLGYLNVPGYVYSTVRVVTLLPWSFKFLLGLINDTCPIGGYRRKPYMVFGWALCAGMLVLLWQTALPDPYWCLSEVDGSQVLDASCETDADCAQGDCHDELCVCNVDAQELGGSFALLMMVAATGYVIADVAADGLTVELARREPVSRRGRTQTTACLQRESNSHSPDRARPAC